MAAAVASGEVAGLLSVLPDLDPDDVKAALMNGAYDVAGDRTATGAGGIDVVAAQAAAQQLSQDRQQWSSRSVVALVQQVRQRLGQRLAARRDRRVGAAAGEPARSGRQGVGELGRREQRLDRRAGVPGPHLGAGPRPGRQLAGPHLGRPHVGRGRLGRSHLGRSHLGVRRLGGAHLGGAHLGGPYLGGAYVGRSHLGRGRLGGTYVGARTWSADDWSARTWAARYVGRSHLGSRRLGHQLSPTALDAPAHNGRVRTRQKPLPVLIGGLLLLGALLVTCLFFLPNQGLLNLGFSAPVGLAGLIALAAFAELAYVRVPHGDITEDLTFFEAIVVMAALVLPPLVVITGALGGLVLAWIFMRRAWVKTVFNVGMFAAATSTMLIVAHAIGGQHHLGRGRPPARARPDGGHGGLRCGQPAGPRQRWCT